jgi:hypothetical protein
MNIPSAFSYRLRPGSIAIPDLSASTGFPDLSGFIVAALYRPVRTGCGAGHGVADAPSPVRPIFNSSSRMRPRTYDTGTGRTALTYSVEHEGRRHHDRSRQPVLRSHPPGV